MKAIIFDKDGVLINTEPLHYKCWREILKEDGIDLEYDIYKECIGATRAVLLDILKEHYDKTYEDIDEVMNRMKDKKLEFIKAEGFPMLDGIKDSIETLHRAGYHLAVASSSPRESIEMELDAIGIRKYFEDITSGLEVEHSKPAPDIFLCAMKKLHLTPAECLVVEDSTNGGKAAEAAGMKCVWYHNPDSGDQLIPQAELEISAWTPENVNKILGILEKY
ncbi:HAD family hydrolase [Blautia sp. MSJ-19]|uniref:HAD family hydrolase n=1 Tax=Blautia sp. MSJ-19 TaxID=2841517 RepID=UPI001C0ED4D0|nr:HAD family phosphatase [Blautia sp. MSJ-19]MBU5480573.1 HAD family phosphatase [Blautia sp. MSJ-19]